MSVGNDVVDLGDPETRLGGLHPRFVERVFSPAERAALERCLEPHVLHWGLWAAKESAYKACRRLDVEAVFSPRAFEAELPAWPPEAGVAVGQVTHRGATLAVEVRLAGECLHAVATAGGASRGAVLLGIGRAGDDPSGAACRLALAAGRVASATGPAGDDPGRAARDLARAEVALALGLDPRALSIDGRPPVVRWRGGRLDVDLSLSHHGRFVAFAGRRTGPGAGS